MPKSTAVQRGLQHHLDTGHAPGRQGDNYVCPECDFTTTDTFDRDVLIDVLVHHWPTTNNGCHCGWEELGKSYPEHVVKMYEKAITDG